MNTILPPTSITAEVESTFRVVTPHPLKSTLGIATQALASEAASMRDYCAAKYIRKCCK